MQFIKCLLILATLLAATICLADSDASPLSTQVEMNRLEQLKAHGKNFGTDERNRLAEIYFLLSRCDDVGNVAPASSVLWCLCGGACKKLSGPFAHVGSFKKLLRSKRVNWYTPKVKKLWKQVKAAPEARYIAFKYLSSKRYAKDARARALRSELERSLDSLEVRDQK